MSVPSDTELHAAVPLSPAVVDGEGEAVIEGVIVTFVVGTLVKLEDSGKGDSVIGCVTVGDPAPTETVGPMGKPQLEGYG